MHYVIYPDTLFLENLLCNLLFLIFVKVLFFQTLSWKKLLFTGTAVALCNTLASILFFRWGIFLQIGVLFPAAGLMICSCLSLKDGRRILYLLYRMILWTLVFGGSIQFAEQWLSVRTEELLFGICFLALIFGVMERIFRIYRKQDEGMREVVLYWKEKSCHIRGFVDTGNRLRDPVTGKPVSIITVEAWKLFTEDLENPAYFMIPYHTIGNPHGILKGIQIDYMVISKEDDSRIYEKPMIGITEEPFSGIFHYSILLHSYYG